MEIDYRCRIDRQRVNRVFLLAWRAWAAEYQPPPPSPPPARNSSGFCDSERVLVEIHTRTSAIERIRIVFRRLLLFFQRRFIRADDTRVFRVSPRSSYLPTATRFLVVN